MLPQIQPVTDPRLAGLVIPRPTPVAGPLDGLGGIADPLWGFFEQRIFGIPVWALGLGVAAYFLFRPASKSPKRAWDEA